MKVTFRDGTVQEFPFTAENCTGYIAKSIEIGPRDIVAMLDMNRSNNLFLSLHQLLARFESERAIATDITDAWLKDILVLGYENDPEVELKLARIEAERRRQITIEGWGVAHDEQHNDGVLLRVAVMYYRNAVFGDLVMRNVSYGSRGPGVWVPVAWEWDAQWWKPKDATRDLERAGALCLAERDRLWHKRADHPCAQVRHKLGLICEALVNIDTPRQRAAQLLRSIAGLS